MLFLLVVVSCTFLDNPDERTSAGPDACLNPNIVCNNASGYCSIESMNVPVGVYNTAQRVYFPNLRQLNGDLEVFWNSIINYIGFPKLETVIGNIHIGGSVDLQLVEFPKLKMVWGNIDIDQPGGLEKIEFPSLDFVAGNIMSVSQKISYFNFSSLREIRLGGISITTNKPSTIRSVLSFPSLTTLLGFGLHGGQWATLVEFPLLEDIYLFSISGQGSLETVRFPRLKRMNEPLSISDTSNPALRTVEICPETLTVNIRNGAAPCLYPNDLQCLICQHKDFATDMITMPACSIQCVTQAPTVSVAPTLFPTRSPTRSPTLSPTRSPTTIAAPAMPTTFVPSSATMLSTCFCIIVIILGFI